jgi:hypothetical protein
VTDLCLDIADGRWGFDGITGQLVAHLTRLGVQPITGKLSKPTTQGQERAIPRTVPMGGHTCRHERRRR